MNLFALVERAGTVILRTEGIFNVLVSTGVFDVSETVTFSSSRCTSFPRTMSPFERVTVASCFGAFSWAGVRQGAQSAKRTRTPVRR